MSKIKYYPSATAINRVDNLKGQLNSIFYISKWTLTSTFATKDHVHRNLMNQQLEIFNANLMAAIENILAGKSSSCITISDNLDSQDFPVAINGTALIQHIQKCHSLLQSSVTSRACLDISNRPKKAESCIQICSPAA
eukprot:7053891-Ditylum_brightwellii.AAC.1